jgi:hypothetical protein
MPRLRVVGVDEQHALVPIYISQHIGALERWVFGGSSAAPGGPGEQERATMDAEQPMGFEDYIERN